MKKDTCRLINNILIENLFSTDNALFFYDESIFMPNGFARAAWQEHHDEKAVVLRRPNMYVKLNMIVSKESIVTFQLCDSKHTQKDVANFLNFSMHHVRKNLTKATIPILVLDNSPKNRSASVFSLADSCLFLPLFTVPGSPEQNYIEQMFGNIKRRLLTLEVLARINASRTCYKTFMAEIIFAMSKITAHDFVSCQAKFYKELSASTLVAMKNQNL